MSFDFGELFSRTWQITWKHKVLWAYGFLLAMLSSLFLLLTFAPTISSIFSPRSSESMIEQRWIFLIGFLAIAIVMYSVSVLMNSAIIIGLLHGERGEEKLSLMNSIRESYSFFWRMMAIFFIFMGSIALVVLAFLVFQTIVALVTVGLGVLCLTPLAYLTYPMALLWHVCMEQTMAAVVVDNMSVSDAIQQGWQLLKKNFWTLIPLGLVLFSGVSIATGIAVIPVMFALYSVPISLESAGLSWPVFLLTGLCLTVYMPIYSIVQGGILAFIRSSWVLTYLRLTRSSSGPRSVLQEATT